MSKELEAFYEVLERSEFAYIGHNDVDIVIKALTPPTAEEVCKALEEWDCYGEKIQFAVYSQKSKQFTIKTKTGNLFTIVYDKYGVLLPCKLPPHLITLIGRFYESVVK